MTEREGEKTLLRYVTFWNRTEPGEVLRPDEDEFGDSSPYFESETWPLIEKYKASITGLVWWDRRKQRGPQALLRHLVRAEEGAQDFFRLADLSQMTSDDLDRVFTCTDSDLSLFFETGDQWFIRHLCNLWPRPGVLHVNRERLTDMSDHDFGSLCKAIDAIPEDKVWLTFDDEGWLLYVFGSTGLLAWAQSGGGRRETNEARTRALLPEAEKP